MGSTGHGIKKSTMLMTFAAALAMSAGTFLHPTLRYGVAMLVIMSILLKGKSHLQKKGIVLFYTLLSLDIFVSMLYSPNMSESFKLVLIYFCSLLFIIADVDDAFYKKLFHLIEVVIIVYAVSIIVSAIAPPVMFKLAFMTSKTVAAIQKDMSRGAYAGLAGDRGEAAVLMCMGIAIGWAKYASKITKLKSVILELSLLYIALLLTSKRMMFVISLIIPTLVLIMFTKGKRRITVCVVAGIGVITVLFLSSRIPALNNIFIRLADTEDLLTMNGRARLWDISKQMFLEHKLFGTGFNSFNTIAFSRGIQYSAAGGGTEMVYQGHNSYLQMLGELGIVGFSFYVLLQISVYTGIYKLILSKDRLDLQNITLLYTCFFIIVLFTVYGYTGNCAYYPNQVFIQAITYGFVVILQRKLLYQQK